MKCTDAAGYIFSQFFIGTAAKTWNNNAITDSDRKGRPTHCALGQVEQAVSEYYQRRFIGDDFAYGHTSTEAAGHYSVLARMLQNICRRMTGRSVNSENDEQADGPHSREAAIQYTWDYEASQMYGFYQELEQMYDRLSWPIMAGGEAVTEVERETLARLLDRPLTMRECKLMLAKDNPFENESLSALQATPGVRVHSTTHGKRAV